MGLYDLNNPGRAGFDAKQYDGWMMANIIRDFVFNRDLTTEWDRVCLRKAMLVSDEYRKVSEGVMFHV